MFMHGGMAAPGRNMLYLIIFWRQRRRSVSGIHKFLIFYLLCGIAAMFSQLAVDPYSSVSQPGASGAIAGVLGAYLVLFPQRRVRVLLVRWIVHMPALIRIGG
jgi:membrane associated rhomboid family serine protease